MGCFFMKPDVNRSVYDMNPVKKSPVIFVSGVPGAGYNTVSQTLAAITGYHVINPGELVRTEAADITTLRGMRLSKMLMENKVSEEIIVDLVKENMLEHVDAKGFILCGFPKNKKMASIYNKEVKTPEKVIALQVADEIATMRLQQKLTELGRSQTEVQEAEGRVRSAVPKIKKVTDRFKKDSVITVNSSQELGKLNETLQTATESFKEFMQVENKKVSDVPKCEDDFDIINLSDTGSYPQISSSLPLKEIIESLEEKQKRDIKSTEEMAKQTEMPEDVLCDQDLNEVSKAPFNISRTSTEVELNQYFCNLEENAENSQGVTASQSYNRLGKTPESTDLLNTEKDVESFPETDRHARFESRQHTSQTFRDYIVHDPKYHKRSTKGFKEYNSLITYHTDQRNTESEPFKDLMNKTGPKRIINSAETAYMRDYMKVCNLTEATETCQ